MVQEIHSRVQVPWTTYAKRCTNARFL